MDSRHARDLVFDVSKQHSVADLRGRRGREGQSSVGLLRNLWARCRMIQTRASPPCDIGILERRVQVTATPFR